MLAVTEQPMYRQEWPPNADYCRMPCFSQAELITVELARGYQTGVSAIVGNGFVGGPELAEFGLAKASGVIEVMLIAPSTLFGETELLDWPATIASEPTLPDIKGASAPRFMIPILRIDKFVV